MDLLFKRPTLKSTKVVEFHQFNEIDVLSCCKSMEHIVSSEFEVKIAQTVDS
jgi:hypothetical protein